MFEKKEDYVEMTHDEPMSKQKIPIHIEKMNEYADSDRIQRKLREGAVMLVNVKDFRDKNISELKRAIERIKKTCDAVGGDVIGVSNDWLIVCPANAHVERS
ncbi:MAG: cell division protein SepF [Candidatus Aenigmarchaeota archaeon]|nr:cell division protein SepF [Candidatus Aenigmarchaeota archaeon]